MIDRLRAYFTVVHEGSVNRSAALLRISQPALSRQMITLCQRGKIPEATRSLLESLTVTCRNLRH